MHRSAAVLLVVCLLAATPASARTEEVQGIVEAVKSRGILLDSTLVILNEGTRFGGDADSVRDIKVGHWAEARGDWTDHGNFKAERISTKADVPGHTFYDKLLGMSAKESGSLNESDKVYDDPAVAQYVSRVGEGLVPEYARSEFDFSFHVLEDPSLNAFAFPSGAIYVHTGLLAKMDNEAQLAAVLGHEISHVTQRHGQRQYKKMVAFAIPAQIGSILLGVQVSRRTDNPVYATMAALGMQLGLSAAVNGYGRTLEDQADRVGLRYAVETGYDPRESPKVWDTFNDIYGDEGKVENFFYSNHSTNEVRKENLTEEIERHYREVPDSPREVDAGEYQRTMLNLIRDNAVLDFEVGRYRIAEQGMDRVLEQRPGDPVAQHYKGRIILATQPGETAKQRALSRYLKALSLAPDYADAHRDLGLLYADMGRPADARAHLERYLELAPKDAKDLKEIRKALARLPGG